MFKSFFKMLISSLLLLLLSSLPAWAIPMASLNLMDSDIYVGESFDVQVFVDGDDIGLELLTFGFDVNTTGGVFTYDGYTVETGFDDLSAFVPPEISGNAFPGISADDVLLATLSFTATSTGTGFLQTLGVTDNFFIGLAYEINPVTWGWYDIDASLGITVNAAPVSPVPEPATCLLFGIGCLGLFGMGNREGLGE